MNRPKLHMSWKEALSVALCAAVMGTYAYNSYTNAMTSDDAFISFCYASNFADGNGLTWTTGDIVEGYTNFLWTAIMGIGLCAGISPEHLAPALGILSAVMTLLGIAWFGARRSSWSNPAIWAAPFLLAFNRTFAAFSTSGLETTFFICLNLFGFLALFEKRNGRWRSLILSSLLFSAGALTRPEGNLFAAIAAMALIFETIRKRERFSRLAIWCGIYLALVGSHFCWRLSTYGFPFPNTFYAKVNGLWWDQSVIYFSALVHQYGYTFLALPAILAVIMRRDVAVATLFTAMVAFAGYVFYVSGDFLEFRLIAPAMPLLYLLASDGVLSLFQYFSSRRAIGIAIAVCGAMLFSFVAYQHYLVSLGSLRMARLPGYLELPTGTNRIAGVRFEQAALIRKYIEAGMIPEQLRYEAGGVGIVPYYIGWYTLDRYGLNDVHVAHQAANSKKRWKIGHEKMATADYLEEKKIDVSEADHVKLVFRARSPRELLALQGRARSWVGRRNMTSTRASSRMRLACYHLRDEDYLIFVMNAPEERMNALFGHLTRC